MTSEPRQTASRTLPNSPLDSRAVLAALLCALLWGANSVAVKFATEQIPPFCMAALRFGSACMVTGGWALAYRQRLRLCPGQVRMVLINSVMLHAQIGLFNVGTHWSTSVHSVILINAFVFFTAIFARYWFPGFQLSWHQSAGLLIAFTGVVVMFGDQLLLPDRWQLLGDLMLLSSAALLGVKINYVKSLLGRISAVQLVFWEAVLAVPQFALTSLCLEGLGHDFTLPAVAAVLYQGWAVSGVAFLLWTTLLARHSPNALASFGLVTPIFGALCGVLFLGESLTPYLAAAGLLIVFGVYIVNRR